MEKYPVDIIVDANGRIVATTPADTGYQIEPIEGHKKHRIELPKHITSNNAAEFHHIISQLLYFENGEAKIKELKKKK